MAARKPKLYIIHGWTYTTAPWAQTISLLEKRGVNIEMLNVPGLTSPSKKVWTIAEYVKWADRNLPDGTIALGHSNGGRILLNLCAEKPEKLKQLILLDAAGVYEVSSKRDVVRSLSKKFSFLKKVPGLTKVWHKLTGTTDYARAPENMKQTLANMLESDKDLDLTKVTTPTSIIWGAADTVTPPHQGEKMHAEIAGSNFDLHTDWTHAPYLSHPKELADAIYYALQHPPVVVAPAKVDDTTAKSAALALKRAPEPVLEKKDHNPVAPDVATKLVLRKDDSKLTKGLVISDAEGAAVKYQPKKIRRLTKTTDAGASSAALALKRTAKKSPTEAADKSETKKSTPETGILAELDQKSDAKVDFVPAELKTISSADAEKLKATKKRQKTKRGKKA